MIEWENGSIYRKGWGCGGSSRTTRMNYSTIWEYGTTGSSEWFDQGGWKWWIQLNKYTSRDSCEWVSGSERRIQRGSWRLLMKWWHAKETFPCWENYMTIDDPRKYFLWFRGRGGLISICLLMDLRSQAERVWRVAGYTIWQFLLNNDWIMNLLICWLIYQVYQ